MKVVLFGSKCLLWSLTLMMFACKSTVASDLESGGGMTTTANTVRFAVNDASILFPTLGTRDDPLPQVALLARDDGQVFIPQSILAAIGSQSKVAKAILKGPVVAMGLRVDHCFPVANVDDAKCTRQVRIVWQPADGGDAALHSLHVLSRSDFFAFLAGIRRLKVAAELTYDNLPLGVHPVLRAQGMNGAFGLGIIALLRQFIGVKNLVGVAFFAGAKSPPGNVGPWEFAAFAFQNGNFVPQAVPHHADTLISISGFPHVNLPSKDDSPLGIFETLPVPVQDGPGGQVGTEYAGTGEANLGSLTEADLVKAYGYLLKVENPKLASIQSNACGDCHLASGQRALVEQAHPELPGQTIASRFQPSLANPWQPALISGSLHNFGYFGMNTEPSISQRTVNETKVVVDWINQNLNSLP